MTEHIKNKVMKLLALAKDSTDEESHTAMLQARKLMMKHNIHEYDLQQESVTHENIVNEKVYRNKLLWWHKRLGVVIADNFRCNCYTNVIGSYEAEIRFVGLEKDVEIATMIYNFARSSIHYYAKLFLLRPDIKRKWKRKHQFKNDYITGYIAGLKKKFQDQNKSESLELVIVQHPLVIEYYNSLGLVPGKRSKHKTAGDHEAWSAGFSDGQRFDSGREMIEP